MKYSRLSIITFSLLTLLAIQTAPALALEPVFSSWGKAIHGYDPVAYFKQDKPVKGSGSFTHKYKGATWYFSSAENLDDFATNPAQYAPQYGGYCAYAVSRGYTASTDPDAWTIKDNKLYLNYSVPTRAIWLQDTDNNIRKANGNWPRLLNDS